MWLNPGEWESAWWLKMEPPRWGLKAWQPLKDRQCPWPPWLVDVHSRGFLNLPHPAKVHRPQKRGLDFL